MANILLIEDDVELSKVICDLFSAENHQVEAVYDGAEGISRLNHYEYDVVIVDWQLPKISGLEIVKQCRSKGNAVPILMLTARRAIEEKESGLDSGSDDYLTKPFDSRELLARVRALLRRPQGLASTVLTVRDIVLDPLSCRVTKGEKEVSLKRQEYLLLEFFMRNPNRVFSPEMLLSRVWNSSETGSFEAVRTSIKRLRKAIDDGDDEKDSIITTVHGLGYRLNVA
jgi:DNA-binding response OmpR family regulator